MPGLIDAHCHMTYGESCTQEEQDLYTSVESRDAAGGVERCKRCCGPGVTSLSQPGGSYYIGVALRDAIASRDGPRAADAHGRPVHHHQQRPDRLVPGRRRGTRWQHRNRWRTRLPR